MNRYAIVAVAHSPVRSIWQKRFAAKKLQRFCRETSWAIRIRTARRKYFRAVRLFQRLFRAYESCTRARKATMRRVWDACEAGASEAFAANLRAEAARAAVRAKADVSRADAEMTPSGPDPEICDARARAAAWRRQKAELVQAAQDKRRRRQRDEARDSASFCI